MRLTNSLIKGIRRSAFLLDKLASVISLKTNKDSRIQMKRCLPWFKDNGDKTLRLDYQLDSRSVVFDLGGYEGQWASDIFSKYSCYIHVFEPHPAYCLNIKKRFYPNPKITVYEFGLSNENKKLEMNVSFDSSSLYKRGGEFVDICLVDCRDFFKTNRVSQIDLLKINIEGGEYDLLECLVETHYLKNIKNIQIQFHDFVPQALERMRNIQTRLSDTHTLTYQYEFVWENWKLKAIEAEIDEIK
jgi:FkbM family methyltransferase